MGEVMSDERKTGLSRRGRSSTEVLWNIGQACELVYNPVQPECKLNERKEQKIKWGNRLSSYMRTNYFLNQVLMLLRLKGFEHSTKEFELYNEPSRVF